MVRSELAIVAVPPSPNVIFLSDVRDAALTSLVVASAIASYDEALDES